MNKILKEWNEFLLQEKSLSRALEHIMRHDTVFISAYRGDPQDYSKCMPNYSKNIDNQDRNKELKASLMEDPQFEDFITDLSQFFCQDSFLFVPRGGEESYLIGTNRDDFPGYGKQVEMGSFHGGKEAEFMTRVGQRPLHFAEALETKFKKQNNTKFLISRLAKKILQEMKGDN